LKNIKTTLGETRHTHFVITEHRLKYSHKFDWNNVIILDKEIYFNKRLISKMIHIKKQIKGLNLQKDTELLDPIDSDIIVL